MTRRLVVLGGTGFLGPHLLRAAAAAGFEPLAVARRAPDRARADVTDHAALECLVDATAPRAIVNAAALARIADCDADPGLARRVNADAAGAVARIAAARGLRLVYVSTDLVFGAASAPPGGFAERDEPSPASVYGATKLAGERAVLAAHPGALVVRLPLLCGDSLGRALGASDAVLAAVARGERPRLFRDEWRTPLDVADAAAAIVELVEGDASGTLHVAGPERMTRLELGLRALRAAGRADAATLVDSALRDGQHAGRPADVSLDASHARALLSTRLRTPFA